MKFGKEFVAQMVPEWQAAYMDYNFLKMLLKDLLRYKERNKGLDVNPTALKKAMTFRRAFSGLTRRYSPRHGHARKEEEEEAILVKNIHRDGEEVYETMFLMSAEDGGEYDVVFFRRLDEELNKVNIFYRTKVEELVSEAVLLDKQMESMIAFRAILRNPFDASVSGATVKLPQVPLNQNKARLNKGKFAELEAVNEIEMNTSGSSVNEISEEIQRPGACTGLVQKRKNVRIQPLDAVKNVQINITAETPRSTIRSILINPENRYLGKEDLRRGKKMLREAFVEFYKKLTLVKSYSSLNLLAFSKIMKKYDKVTRRHVSHYYLSIIDKSYLGNHEEVNKLLERVESTFIKHFTNSNRKAAAKILRPRRKHIRHRVSFFIGLFVGSLISLLVALLIMVRMRHIYDNVEVTKYMDVVFPLYSMLGFVFLHMIVYAADLYLWQRFRINYPFIFGFKPGTELGYKDVFLIATGLSVLTMAGVISNLEMNTEKLQTIPECTPLALVLVLLLMLICPFNIFYRSSRYFLIRSAFRCICAPFYKVVLVDFFLADQITSQVQALRYFEYFICYYGWGDFKKRDTFCKDTSTYKIFYFIVAVVPFWCRFLQCIRRLVEEGDAMQGCNALKVLAIIIAVIMRTAYSMRKGYMLMVISYFASAIAMGASIYWDIVVDWGLLQHNSKNPWLRDKLVISQKSIYFIAMILNVVLRFAWIQSIMNFKISNTHLNVTIAIFSCFEIVRRGVWNFFRIENEHLNNVGKFRAFKSVPLPFQHPNDDDDDDDNNDNDT